MDVNATNYNSTVEVDDGSCEYPEPIEGCMDVNATNYNSTAEIDDGSCEYPEPVKGCTNETANNYNSTAEVDDGSCDFTEEKLDYCPDEINEDNENLVDDSCLVPDDESNDVEMIMGMIITKNFYSRYISFYFLLLLLFIFYFLLIRKDKLL